MKTLTYEQFEEKYSVKSFTIYENDLWVISLRPIQKTPFSLLLSHKANTSKFSDLDKESLISLRDAYYYIEKRLGVLIGVDKINYLALMMVDSIIHFHVFPRFSSVVKIGTEKFSDKYYPYPVDILDDFSIDFELIMSSYSQIKEKLESNFID